MIVRCLPGLLLLGAWAATAAAQPSDDPYAAQSALRGATVAEVQTRLEAWLRAAPAGVDVAAVRQRWAESLAPEPLERLTEALAAGEAHAARVVAASQSAAPLDEPTTKWLQAQAGLPGDTLRLVWGRALARTGQYETALPWLSELSPEESVDPAQALFYLAACQQSRLESEECLDTLSRLLEVEPLPARYRVLARQMQAEMRSLEDESLDYVSRQMRDVERRLDRGEADRPLRKVQDDVLAALDKLIQQAEDQQQQSGGGGGGGGGSSSQNGALQPAQAAPDSQLLGGKGAGRTAPKAMDREGGWGALPPREREEAWQQLGREFPSHYRDVVEQYFRELAREADSPAQP